MSGFVEVLRWMRTYDERHPGDPVRLVGLDEPADDMSILVRRLAANALRWREHARAVDPIISC